jgi:hypothetical protein
VEHVRLTNEAPAPTKSQPEGDKLPTEAEEAHLRALREQAEAEEAEEEVGEVE